MASEPLSSSAIVDVISELEKHSSKGKIARLLHIKKHQDRLRALSGRLEDAKASFSVSSLHHWRVEESLR